MKVGRIAGQFAKPRSSPTEIQGDTELPSFLGQIVNDIGFSETERRPDPQRLLTAYHRAASTLNLLRAFTRGGYADLSQVSSWNREFVASSPAGERYSKMADEIDRALRFMDACGVNASTTPALHEVDFYTSHEALLLNYEEALTRQDSLTGDWYDCSAHMLWIGERTRELDGAHVSSCKASATPLGCKVGPTATPDDVLALCEALNPETRSRVGSPSFLAWGPTRSPTRCRPSCAAVNETPAIPSSGPATRCTATPTRPKAAARLATSTRFSKRSAASSPLTVQEGTWPGGIHVELTGDAVTECLGGGDGLDDEDLDQAYETMCDPRLNGRQSVDLAFRVAELLRARELIPKPLRRTEP